MNTYTQTVLRGLMVGMAMVSIASAYELSGGATGTFDGVVTNLGTVYVGNKNAGNMLKILNGALVDGGAGIIGGGYAGSSYRSSSGYSSSSSSVSGDFNQVLISGAGSRWSSSGAISAGLTYGRGNSIQILNGGVLSSVSGSIGTGRAGSYSYSYYSSSSSYSTSSTNNSVTVSGSGSRWDNSGSLYVGSMNGNHNSLRIDNGGVVTNTSVIIGNGRAYNSYSWGSSSAGTGNDNLVVVDGAGSEWHSSGAILLGNNNAYRNQILVSNGGLATGESLQVGQGSWGSGLARGNDNSVMVSGSGSRLDIAGGISLGNSYAENNSLTVSDGGTVSAESLSIAAGNYVVLGEGGLLSLSGDFNSSQPGLLNASGGVLSVEGMVSGFTNLTAHTRLESANVNGPLTVHGTFAPGNSPADSLVNGDLTVAPDGTVEMEIGGYGLGIEYDRLTVAGLAELDGTLDIVFLNGFSPTNGASFDLFNWDGGVSGVFADITSSSLADGLSWDTSDLYTSGSLTVIPEPSTIAFIAVFGAGLWAVRRYFPSV